MRLIKYYIRQLADSPSISIEVEMTKRIKPMIKIDKEKCIGCGSCEAVCPKVFKLNEETFKSEAIDADNDDCVQEAIDICPTQAITNE